MDVIGAIPPPQQYISIMQISIFLVAIQLWAYKTKIYQMFEQVAVQFIYIS